MECLSPLSEMLVLHDCTAAQQKYLDPRDDCAAQTSLRSDLSRSVEVWRCAFFIAMKATILCALIPCTHAVIFSVPH